MTCREFIEFLLGYLDGKLSPSERLLFEEHLEACPECTDYLDSYRTTVLLAEEAFCGEEEGDVPPEVPEDLVQAILAAQRSAGP